MAKKGARTGPKRTRSGHQKKVQGKNQRGPVEKAGRRTPGNKGSLGQNIRAGGGVARGRGQSIDTGDARGPHGGSGGGQKNRQNRAVNRDGVLSGRTG
jgi:hypothetical protein